jgi:thiol-disulfide isomerase/thioredoxin
VSIATLGCETKDGAEKSGAKEAPTATSTGEAGKQTDAVEVAAVDVGLRTVDRKEFDEIVTAQKGQIVLVDFWATWCSPCMEQFPHTVELWRKHRDQGLVVISVAFDEEEDEPRVNKFLAAQGADFINLRSEYGFKSTEPFETDNAAIPNYWLFDRSGKLVQRFSPPDPTGHYKPEDLDRAVEALLAQPAGD